MDDKHKTHDLSHGECARCDDVQTNEKKQDKAHSHSSVHVVNVEVSENGHVVIGVRIVQCYHAIMDVVIGVRIVQCYHAIMANSEFSTIGPNYQLVVKLYDLIVTFPVAIYCTLLHRENMSFEVLCLHLPSVTVDRRQL